MKNKKSDFMYNLFVGSIGILLIAYCILNIILLNL